MHNFSLCLRCVAWPKKGMEKTLQPKSKILIKGVARQLRQSLCSKSVRWVRLLLRFPNKGWPKTSQSQVASRNSCTTFWKKLKNNLTQVPSKLKPKLWTAAAATLLQSCSKVAPEAGPPKQSTTTNSNKALNFSPLKKKNFWSVSPLVLTIEGPLQIY